MRRRRRGTGAIFIVAIVCASCSGGQEVNAFEECQDGVYRAFRCADGDMLEVVGPVTPEQQLRWRKGDGSAEWTVEDVAFGAESLRAEEAALASCEDAVLLEIESPN